MDIKAKTKKALPFTVALSTYNMLIPLIGTILLVRYLTSSEYGILVLFVGLVAMINVFFSFGYDHYITRYVPSIKNKKEIAEILWNILSRRLLIALAISVILILTFQFFAKSFDIHDYYYEFLFYQIAIISQIGSLYITRILNARFLQKYELILTIIHQSSRLALICIGIILEKKFMYFIIIFSSLGISRLVIGILIFTYRFGGPDFYDILNFRKEEKEKKSYRRISYINNIGNSFLGTNIDRYILAYFSQNIQVAIYAISTNLLGKILNIMPLRMFFPLLEPAFYSKYDETGKSSDLNRIFQFVFNQGNIISFLFLSLFIPLGKDILQFLFNQNYILAAYWPIIIFLGFLMVYSIPLGMVDKAIKKPKILLIAKVTGLLNIAIGIPLASYYGALGMALATSFSVVLKQIITLILTRKYIELKIPWKSTFKLIVNSAVVMLILFYLHNKLQVNLILLISLGVLIYFILLKLNPILNSYEKKLMESLVPNRFTKIVDWIT